MPDCTTHYKSCDCRELLLKTVCDTLIKEHAKTKRFIGFGYNADLDCQCEGCQAARELLK